MRRQAKVATDRRKTKTAATQPVAGTSKEKAEPVTANVGSTSDKSGRDKGVNTVATPLASSQQAGDHKQGVSKAKMNVIRTMIYIFVCFIICWLPFNIVILYYRITVKIPPSEQFLSRDAMLAWHAVALCLSQTEELGHWVTGSLGHHCDPVCDPEFFNFRFSKKNAYAKLTF